jgi:deferrochelatase/peroxidase EfeB
MPKSRRIQSGITNRPPEHALVAAFDFTGADPAANQAAVGRLRTLVEAESRSDLDDQSPTTDKAQPSPETGELGFDDRYDRAHLTITLGIAKSGFDKLGVAPGQQPQDLVVIPWDQLGDAPQVSANGDLAIQACSDDVYICEHVIRRIEEEVGNELTMVWAQLGSQRYTTRQGRTSREEGRALLGFIDGSSNLDPRHEDNDADLVFVDPSKVGEYPPLPPADQPPAGYGGEPGTAFPPDLRPPPAAEPDWTKDGTYLVVRGSLQNITPWDDLTLGEQEQIIGRFKYSGAFLDLADDPQAVMQPPAFESDQANQTVPLNSHVRKVNPRRSEDAARRVFRRGYPLIQPTGAGLGRGLLFIAFARSISTQFEFITRAWMRNPNFPQPGTGNDRLLEFDPTVVAGGYFFVPSITNKNKPWTWRLPWDAD